MFQDYVLLEWGCEDQEFAVRTLKNGTFTETEAGWLSELEKLTASPPEDLRAARIQTNLAMLYFCHQRYDLSELYFERALASCIRVAGVNSPQTAEYLNNLAGLYYAQRRYTEAEPLCVQILQIYFKMQREENALVGLAAQNLGMVYHCQGKWALAAMCYARALPIRIASCGEGHPDVRALKENDKTARRMLDESRAS